VAAGPTSGTAAGSTLLLPDDGSLTEQGPRPVAVRYLADPEHRMILGVGQLREVRPYMAPGDLALPGDDVPPFVDWDLARVEDLGLPCGKRKAAPRPQCRWWLWMITAYRSSTDADDLKEIVESNKI
jgi:hypothetical protein